MITYLRKWGNSISVRIPRIFSKELDLKNNSPVEIKLTDGALIITPIKNKNYHLDQFLEKISENNLHKEISTGKPMGNEVW
jgi:antitoxin MazE